MYLPADLEFIASIYFFSELILIPQNTVIATVIKIKNININFCLFKILFFGNATAIEKATIVINEKFSVGNETRLMKIKAINARKKGVFFLTLIIGVKEIKAKRINPAIPFSDRKCRNSLWGFIAEFSFIYLSLISSP